MRYTVIVDGEPGAYGVVFPDLPGCTAMGDTVDMALAEAADVARVWMDVVEAKGESVPAPRELSEIRKDPRVVEALSEGSMLASTVVLRTGGRAVRANLSLAPGVLAAIDAIAELRRDTRSGIVERLAEVGLPLLS